MSKPPSKPPNQSSRRGAPSSPPVPLSEVGKAQQPPSRALPTNNVPTQGQSGQGGPKGGSTKK